MSLDSIVIKGAREHNLKNVDLVLPRNRLIVITGLSGSGKSSLAFDTDLRRRAAALRRVALLVRAPVSRPDGEARRRLHRRALSRDLDRSKIDLAQSALDGRNGDGDLRLSAPALRPDRNAALLSVRARDQYAVERADRRIDHGSARGDADGSCSRRWCAGARASIRSSSRRLRRRASRAYASTARPKNSPRRSSSTRSASTRSRSSSTGSSASPRFASGSPIRSKRRCGSPTES